VQWCEGKPVLPGIRRRTYFTHKTNITKWPTLSKDSAGRVTDPKYVGSFELAEGAKWKSFDVDTNKSGLTSEPQGETPSQTQLNKFVGVHPDVSYDATMLSSYVNNSDVVYLVPQADGKYRVIGNEMYPTKSTVNQDGGQGPTGTAGTTLNVEVTDFIPAPFYEGEIEAEDATINPQGSGSGSGSGSAAGSGSGSGSGSGNAA